MKKKLSVWAKENGLSYRNAWNWIKSGIFPAKYEITTHAIHPPRYILLFFINHAAVAATIIKNTLLCIPHPNKAIVIIVLGWFTYVIASMNIEAPNPFLIPFTPYCQKVNMPIITSNGM